METDHGMTAMLETAGKSFKTAFINILAFKGTTSEMQTVLDGLKGQF